MKCFIKIILFLFVYFYSIVNSFATKYNISKNTNNNSSIQFSAINIKPSLLNVIAQSNDKDIKTSTENIIHYENIDQLSYLFFITLIVGILAVFTPYVYAILPITISYISIISKTKSHGIRNLIFYALDIVIIFTMFGVLISIFIGTTGIEKIANNWIFNIFFCRIFLGLGLSFLGAFEINLPFRWTRRIDSMSGVDSFKGIFYFALTLPLLTISSTGPIVGLIMVFASKRGFAGPIVGMLGFSIGFGLPFLFPKILNIISKSINWLNHVKVLMGFFSLLIGIRFLTNADVALNWNLLDRDTIILLWILLSCMMGIYMLGYFSLSNDYLNNLNVYNQKYISLSNLFLSIAFFSFAFYLLPGLWGAPLYRVSGFLPPIR